ncbi:MAG: hypothetical protein QF864_13915, partial [SAR202 cluster bacterium]|nr:hypothetical protein [SAR202 cluster bacterium]
ITINKMKIANKLLKELYIKPFYLMISYNEGENLDSAYKSAKLIYELENNCDLKSVLIPPKNTTRKVEEIPVMGHHSLPTLGTSFRADLKEKGIFLAKKWSDYSIDKISFLPKDILNDIPIKNNIIDLPVNSYLNKYKILIKEYISTSFYLPDVMKDFKSIEDYTRLLNEIYLLCNGKYTVNEIAEMTNKNNNIAIELTVSGLMILSILRLIRSKNPRI